MLERAADPELGRTHRLLAAVLALAAAAAIAHRNGYAPPRTALSLDALRPAAAAFAAARDGLSGVDPRLRAADRRAAEAEARARLAEIRAQAAEGRAAALERLAGLAPAAPTGWRAARLVGLVPPVASAGRSALLDAGAADGVRAGASVVAVADGRLAVLGRVEEVGARSSRVRLVDDAEARVATSVGVVGAAVYEGGWPAHGSLRYVPRDAEIRPGDEVATSAAGTLYPPGLPLARVVSVDPTAEGPFVGVRVAPLVRAEEVRYVLVETDAATRAPAFEAAPPAPAAGEVP